MPIYLKVIKSPRKNKKLRAIFSHYGKQFKTVDFGAKGYMDYVKYIKRDGKQVADMKRNSYISRHKPRELTLWKKNLYAPATLSRFLLWEYPTMKKAVAEYQKKLNK